MDTPDETQSAACLVLVVDEVGLAQSWHSRLSPMIEVRSATTSEFCNTGFLQSVIADWPTDRPWALLVTGMKAPDLVARATQADRMPYRVFVASAGGILANPVESPMCPITIILSEDAPQEERERATFWAPGIEDFAGGLTVRLVPSNQEPPTVCHPHLALGIREDLAIP